MIYNYSLKLIRFLNSVLDKGTRVRIATVKVAGTTNKYRQQLIRTKP
jgi:RNase P/RNase MRP subunit POP5